METPGSNSDRVSVYSMLQGFLTYQILNGEESFQNFVAGVYLMNKVGRHLGVSDQVK